MVVAVFFYKKKEIRSKKTCNKRVELLAAGQAVDVK